MHQREAIKRTIDRAIKLRVSVTQSACNACERKPTCPYLQQWREDGPGLVIVPQAYFRLGVIPGVTGAAEAANDKVPPAPVALVVIDESITNALRRSQRVDLDWLSVAMRPGITNTPWSGEAPAIALKTIDEVEQLDCRALDKFKNDEAVLYETTRAIRKLLKAKGGLSVASVAQALKVRDGRSWAKAALERFQEAESELTSQVQRQMRLALTKAQFDPVDSNTRRRLLVVRWMIGFLELLDHHAHSPSRTTVVGVSVGRRRCKSNGTSKKVRFAELNHFGTLPEFADQHPLLILDATADAEVVKLTLARTPREKERVVSISADPEHAKLTMVHGAPTRMGELAPKDLVITGKRQAADHPVERLHALMWMLDAHARRNKSAGSVGLVTYKRACEYFEQHGLLKDMPKMHFGALRGLDGLEDVSTLVIAGRLWPPQRAVSKLTEALLAFDPDGREVAPGELESRLRGIRIRDGRCAVVAQTEHSSPITDLVLRSLVDAEVVQALGRGRALQRCRKKPLRVLLLADRVIDATFDEVAPSGTVLPSVRTAMLIGQGVVPEKAKAVWEVGKGLFDSLDQAQGWAETEGGADHAGEAFWLGVLGHPSIKTRTVAIPGQHTQEFTFLGTLDQKLRRLFAVETRRQEERCKDVSVGRRHY